METKELALSLKAEGAEGEIVGYGSIFGNVDAHGDRIVSGAFKNSLEARSPKMLWQHDMYEPIGRWTEAREDDKGLYLKGKLSTGTARGRDAYELIKDGALDGLSIGYRTLDYEMDGGDRVLKQLELYEVSVVTLGANALATITGVKAGEMTERDFERSLRQMGWDRTAAKCITAVGFKGYLDGLRDAGVQGPEDDLRDADDLKHSLETLLQTIGGRNV